MHKEFQIRNYDKDSMKRMTLANYILAGSAFVVLLTFTLTHTLVNVVDEEEDYNININNVLYEEQPNLSENIAMDFQNKNLSIAVEIGPGAYMPQQALGQMS